RSQDARIDRFINTGVVVQLDVKPDNGSPTISFTGSGGLDPSSFTLCDAPGCVDIRNPKVLAAVPGTGYSVTQQLPAGYEATSVSCSDGSDPANITLSAGEIVTCTFPDTRLGRITVVQDSSPENE